LFYYRVDLVKEIRRYGKGRGRDPRLILALIDRLPDDSMTAAVAHGGDEWDLYFGWGVDRSLAASTFDINTVTARAAGNWKKPPKFELWPRPWVRKKPEVDPSKPKLDNLFAMFAAGSGVKSG
jgi:hypothetical protein